MVPKNTTFFRQVSKILRVTAKMGAGESEFSLSRFSVNGNIQTHALIIRFPT